MKPMLFVWDFHGTLETGNVRAVQELVNMAAEYVGESRRMSLEEAVELYGLSWIDYFRFVHPSGNQQAWLQMKTFVSRPAREIVPRHIKSAPHAQAVLSKIKSAGSTNVIMSNTAPDALRWFVKLVALDQYIDDYIGLDMHSEPRQKTEIQQLKAQALQSYIKSNHHGTIIKIGDRESDIQAGQAVGATTYYVRNQFNKEHVLQIRPDYEISDLRDILQEI